MYLILDLGVLLIIFLAIILCYHKGLIRSLLGLFSNILAVIVSSSIGGLITDFIYQNFIKQKIISSISDSIKIDDIVSIENVTDNLPDYAKTLLGMFGYTTDSITQNVGNEVEKYNVSIAECIEKLLEPICKAFLGFIVIIILFIIIRIVINLIIKAIDKLTDVKVIRTVNKVLGGVFGLIDGLLIAYFAVGIFALIVPAILGSNMTYSEFNKIAFDSYIFRFFYKDNIITSIFI